MIDTHVAMSALSVMHIGAGRYRPGDRTHSTFDIWRAMASGFRKYTVINRSTVPAYSRLVEGNITVHSLPSRISSESEFLVTQFLALKYAEEASADVVICQSPALGGWAGLLMCRIHGAKMLVELHTDEFFHPSLPGSRNWLVQQLSKPVLRRAQKIRALTPRMCDCAVEKYGSKIRDRIESLPPRVDLSRFDPKTSWEHAELLRVVMVGSLIPRKRQLHFISILIQSGLQIELRLVGTGPDMDACKELVTSSGIDRMVIFFGQVDHAELGQILRDSDVFLMYSLHEGTPRAIMEAMAVALPIVTTNAGFCADIVRNGVDGIVLGNQPDAEVISALKLLQSDTWLRKSMGLAARQRAESEYCSDRLYAQYRDLVLRTFLS